MNADMMKKTLNLCDEAHKGYEIGLKILQDKGYLSLYNEHGESHAGLMTISEWLLVYRTFVNSYWPEDKVKELEDAYSQEDNENDVTPSFKDDTALLKQLSNVYVTTTKDRNPDLTEEEIKSKDKQWWFDENQGPYGYSFWMIDKTKPAPIEAVTYWNNHTVTNDWYITIDGYETQGTKEVLNNKTVEEIKARLDELVTERVGEPLVSSDVEPVDFDEYGGVIMNKSMKDADDEDTFMVTDYLGNSVAVDGIEKAIETATAYRKARAEFQLSFFIWRKITEPDGYFAWREENIADYL
jgi:hypothetical protein